MNISEVFNHRISIVTGHYGTGKTEFAVNLALELAKSHNNVMIADLDIVNPYFRSRERKKEFDAVGVKLISSSQEAAHADIPALPAELFAIFQNRDIRGILDIGGDPVGARVLARFQPQIVREDYELLFVVNANRPEVRTADSAIEYLRKIEDITGLKCSGLVNNTHLCGETTEAEVRKGAALAAEISQKTGIPVRCHVAVERLSGELADLNEPLFPISIKMKKPWE